MEQVCLPHWCHDLFYCCCSDPKSSSTGVSNRVTIIVTVLSILSAVTLIFIVLLLIYIVRKRLLLYRNKTRLPPLMDDEGLFPVSLDIPNEPKSTRQPSLVCFIHLLTTLKCLLLCFYAADE